MKKILEGLMVFRNSGEVRRLHTIPTITKYDIASHVYNSLLVLHTVCHGGEERVDMQAMTKYLLIHDAPELKTGDIPAPVKWASSELNDIVTDMERDWYDEHGLEWMLGLGMDELEKRICKTVDMLELFLFCHREVLMGNRLLEEVHERAFYISMDRVTELPEPFRTNGMDVLNIVEREEKQDV